MSSFGMSGANRSSTRRSRFRARFWAMRVARRVPGWASGSIGQRVIEQALEFGSVLRRQGHASSQRDEGPRILAVRELDGTPEVLAPREPWSRPSLPAMPRGRTRAAWTAPLSLSSCSASARAISAFTAGTSDTRFGLSSPMAIAAPQLAPVQYSAGTSSSDAHATA